MSEEKEISGPILALHIVLGIICFAIGIPTFISGGTWYLLVPKNPGELTAIEWGVALNTAYATMCVGVLTIVMGVYILLRIMLAIKRKTE